MYISDALDKTWILTQNDDYPQINVAPASHKMRAILFLLLVAIVLSTQVNKPHSIQYYELPHQ
jgi:hypothetical protein